MVNVAGARENVGSPVVQQSGIQCFNYKEYGHFAKECRKPKKVKDSTYHQEKMLLYKQAKQVVPLQAEQYDWLADTDEEVDEQELEAHYNYMAKIQEVPTADSDTDSEPVEQNDQNDVESDDERVALANLIANLKLDVDENNKIQKQLKKANTTLAQELKECKTILAKTKMHADLKYVESLEKEIDELESDKAEFSDMYDVILQECVSKDVMCSYLMSLYDLDALDELQCMYLHKVKECDCLAQKLSKQTESVSKKFDRPSVVRQPNAQRIPKPSVLGKPTPFLNSLERIYFSKTKSVPKTNVSEGLSKPVTAQTLPQTAGKAGLSKPVTAQTLPQTARKAVSNTNELKPGMYRINNKSAHTRAPQLPQTVRNTNPHVSTSTGVNHKTNASRPQLKSNQSRDKVLPNNSQVKVKKTQVEVYHRIPSVSNKMKYVTVCKDSLNYRTLNANAVCATCNKCLVDSNHFACVTKMLNDMNARTKKPIVVHISAIKPKSQANKSVSTSHKKQVASKSTKQKPQSYFRMLYENTSKA
uniref:CCHC-type domain-containing protein n=1 Tax=Tanacetum cinerariifolium TaxID=118510 RepID=A0A6L2LQB4_TANCI|nr:hypothetical protein [Tanacetum cinerariifolium]